MTAAERVCAEVQGAFLDGDPLEDWQAEHIPECEACQTALAGADAFAPGEAFFAAPGALVPAVGVAARLDAGLAALVSPSAPPTATPTATPLPWAWIACLALGLIIAFLAGLRHPCPEPEVRDAWRARPHTPLSPAELPLEAIGDPRAFMRGVSE